MKSTLQIASLGITLMAALAAAQTAGKPAPPASSQTTPAAQTPATRPLQLQTLEQATRVDPFPPTDPKNFNADTPSVATVEAYLKAMLGYDANRIWRVAAIQKTASPGVIKVVALVSERTPNAKVLTAGFFVMPDGKHLISDNTGVQPFGANPFADARALLQARADGPARGPASKDLMLVEFADLQCPHCKDAQPIMARLAQDFPRARIVYESFPLTQIHPYAFQAAAYGACVAQKSSEAFFTYAQAVYDTQGALLPDTASSTLNNAITKAGLDPASVATCASGSAARQQVNASAQLALDLGVDQTPVLAVNGRLVPLTAVPYETLKSLIAYQATLDGVPGMATSLPAVSSTPLKPR